MSRLSLSVRRVSVGVGEAVQMLAGQMFLCEALTAISPAGTVNTPGCSARLGSAQVQAWCISGAAGVSRRTL